MMNVKKERVMKAHRQDTHLTITITKKEIMNLFEDDGYKIISETGAWNAFCDDLEDNELSEDGIRTVALRCAEDTGTVVEL